jgi:hypothetical protein
MAIHDIIIERHICTSEWAVSNLLPSKEYGLESIGKLSFFLQGGGAVWADVFRNDRLFGKWQSTPIAISRITCHF